jgi:hypothetical protein
LLIPEGLDYESVDFETSDGDQHERREWASALRSHPREVIFTKPRSTGTYKKVTSWLQKVPTAPSHKEEPVSSQILIFYS